MLPPPFPPLPTAVVAPSPFSWTCTSALPVVPLLGSASCVAPATSAKVSVADHHLFMARQKDRRWPSPRASSACNMYLQWSIIWCENHFITIKCQISPVWQQSPTCARAGPCISFQLCRPCAGGCCPLTSPSSRPLQLSKSGWDKSLLHMKHWWPSGSDVGPCSRPVASPQGTPEVLLLVWWRLSTEPVYTVLARFQPRWLKWHQVRSHIQCQRRMCDNTYLFAKEATPSPFLHPRSQILDISSWSLVQSTTTSSLFRVSWDVCNTNIKDDQASISHGKGTHLETSKLQTLRDMH